MPWKEVNPMDEKIRFVAVSSLAIFYFVADKAEVHHLGYLAQRMIFADSLFQIHTVAKEIFLRLMLSHHY